MGETVQCEEDAEGMRAQIEMSPPIDLAVCPGILGGFLSQAPGRKLRRCRAFLMYCVIGSRWSWPYIGFSGGYWSLFQGFGCSGEASRSYRRVAYELRYVSGDFVLVFILPAGGEFMTPTGFYSECYQTSRRSWSGRGPGMEADLIPLGQRSPGDCGWQYNLSPSGLKQQVFGRSESISDQLPSLISLVPGELSCLRYVCMHQQWSATIPQMRNHVFCHLKLHLQPLQHTQIDPIQSNDIVNVNWNHGG